jgi:hypothetical protein
MNIVDGVLWGLMLLSAAIRITGAAGNDVPLK